MSYAVVAFVVLFMYGWYVEPARLQLRRHLIGHRRIRILFISDPHLGRHLSGTMLTRCLARLVGGERFDLVLLGGDYLDRELRYLPELRIFAEWASSFGAPVMAVLGNHDHDHGDVDPRQIASALDAAGVTVLDGRSVSLMLAGRPFRIAGASDLETSRNYAAAGPDGWRRAAAQLPAPAASVALKGEFMILLTHNPDGAYLPLGTRPDLVLAGHTHGGQAVPVRLAAPLLAGMGFLPKGSFGARSGLLHGGGTPMLISRGAGGSLLPFRLGVPPEIHVLEI